MIQTFLKNTRSHGGVVNTVVVIALADALVERHPDQALNLFHRMGFVRRAGTTRKVEIPAGAKNEVQLAFLLQIANNMRNFKSLHL